MALGGLAIIFFVQRLNWRRASALLLIALIFLDLASAITSTAIALYLLRFAHGLVGGVLIGVSMSVIARTINPERTVALFIMLQLLTGGALTLLLTPLLADLGPLVIWISLAVFALLALGLLPLLGPYPLVDSGLEGGSPVAQAPMFFVVLIMMALCVYQSGEMAAFAYVIELGFSYSFDAGFVSSAVAASLWIGGPAALLLMPVQAAFLLASVGFGIFFSISFPYLMGIAAEKDNTGRMGTASGFAGNLVARTGWLYFVALIKRAQQRTGSSYSGSLSDPQNFHQGFLPFTFSPSPERCSVRY